jgi:hypothetical protein
MFDYVSELHVLNSSDGSSQLIDTLRLTDEQWQNLSEKIDRDDANSTGLRVHARVIYRKLSQIAVAIQQPNGEWSKYVVRSRNLSPGGIGFIHGSFIHVGSLCRVILKDTNSKVVCLDGTIKHCGLIESTAHDIGVQFNKEIDLQDFIKPGEERQAG